MFIHIFFLYMGGMERVNLGDIIIIKNREYRDGIECIGDKKGMVCDALYLSAEHYFL